ncbi:MAG: GlsB/YeaQ/YmgE family stress response membrane protein [Gemmataceae bacterium]
MNFFGWVFAGLFVGAIARLLMPGRQPIGCLATILCGIVGALIGSGVSWAIWGAPDEPFVIGTWPGYLLSIVGALLVLWLAGATAPRRRW